MKQEQIQAFKYALPKTVPVLVGYLFLGAAYGILMKVNGYGLWWILAMSVFVYAGSLQYVGVTLLASAVHPLYALFMALMINARHLFYGLSMLGKFKGLGRLKGYLIFALTDETFSVLCQEEVPEEYNKELVYFWISLLDQLYWITGSILGGLLGQALTFNTKGLDFALTALFVVIFTDQWKNQQDHVPAVIGVLASAACVLLVGKDLFILAAMGTILAILTLKYKKEAVNE